MKRDINNASDFRKFAICLQMQGAENNINNDKNNRKYLYNTYYMPEGILSVLCVLIHLILMIASQVRLNL